MTMTQTDMRPIKDRQEEVDRQMREQLPADVYEGARKFLSTDRMFFMVMPVLMKRELWEKFWSVFRDSVEIDAERMLTELERPKQERGIFG